MSRPPESAAERADSDTPAGEVLVYETPDGSVRVDVRLVRDTVWLTQQQMAGLFGRERSVVAKHMGNTFREGELEPEATCAKFAQVQIEGDRKVSRVVDHYNLDLIISVGYRVKSAQGTRFRQWATRTLREHLVRGYTINRQRFEDGPRAGSGTRARAQGRRRRGADHRPGPHTFSISSSRTTPSPTATSASAPFCSSNSCIATDN